MILYFLLLVGLSFTTRVPRIPASFAKSSVSCELVFDTPVRRVYPQYSIVTGERFIAQILPSPCSILSRQTRAASPCGDGKCIDQATSVVKIDNSTLHYCYTNNKSPEPFTATLLPNNTYEYTSGGLSEICIDDASKTSFTNLDDQLLYIASASFETGLKYYNISKGKTKTPPDPKARKGEVKELTGMFIRGDFIYTVYLDKDVSKITRSCKKDLSSSKKKIYSFTVTDIRCLNSIGGDEFVLDRVLAVEYNSELDKLFVLATKKPVTSSIVALCVLDVNKDIDDVFDTSPYQYYNEDGDKMQTPQDKIDCSVSRTRQVLTVCFNAVNSTSVSATLAYTDVFTFSSYKTLKHHLLYFLSDDSVYVYEYEQSTGKARNLVDVDLWEEVSAISIYQDMLYLTLQDRVFITDPYWCSYYGRDPVGCIAARNPSCSYSKNQSRCIATTKCAPADCVQDLESGSFSKVFPEGYSYQVRGTECENKKMYTDLTVTILPNSTVSTVKSYRDCSPDPDKPVTSGPDPVHGDTKLFTPREIGFLAGMAGFGALSLFLIVILVCKGKNKVSNICTSFQTDPPKIKYTADDKRAIVEPTTPTTPSSDHFNVANGHELVIRNVSAEV